MPHHFEFDHKHGILLTVMNGNIDGDEVQLIDSEMRARIVRTKPAAGISDLTGVTNFNVPSHIMRAAALQHPPFPPGTPRSIVASNDHVFGMSRMYELFADRPAGILKVVRSRQEAFSALGVTTPEFEALD